MQLRRSLRLLLSFVLAASFTLGLNQAAFGQINPFRAVLPGANLGGVLPSDGTEFIVDRCVYLDGRCIFTVAAPRSELETRANYIQNQLQRVKQILDQKEIGNIEISETVEDELHDIMVVAGEETFRLMTVTRWDAEIHGDDIENRTQQIIDQLNGALERRERERNPDFLKRQLAIALCILATTVILVCLAQYWRRRSSRIVTSSPKPNQFYFPQDSAFLPSQLTLRRRKNMQEVQLRAAQFLQWGAIAASLFIILGLFPQTRMGQVWLLGIFRYPVQITVIFLVAYLAIRSSYALIAKVNELFTEGALSTLAFITQESNQRIELRVDTFSQVARSVVTALIAAIALLIFLWSLNIDIAPILAGAGIIGLAISFAAQNLLKDIINGFCIILEDQYAVGDVIGVGDVAGFVENMNLRITQLRDSEGRLITIPNSEVRIVANFSNEWSRADLNIPVPYSTDVDFALKLIGDVATEMKNEEKWQTLMLEDPLILGVDNFHERAIMIKVWIKTMPLKQWEVSREYRRRLKNAFEIAGIRMPTVDNEVWVHAAAKSSPNLTDGTQQDNNHNGSDPGDRLEQLSMFDQSETRSLD
ncbi:MAG: mechanosensitive ion channel family protein [Limnothrix sp.]